MSTSTLESHPYRGNASECGFVRLTRHNLVRLTGRDRHRLLHSFCTADIKQLAVGNATEAFLLDEKGKIIWFCLVLSLADELILIGAGEYGSQVQKHLDRFVIREDVQIADISRSASAFFVTGWPENQKLHDFVLATCGFDRLPGRNEVLENAASTDMDEFSRNSLAQVEIAGWGHLLITGSSKAKVIETGFQDAGLNRTPETKFHLIRVQEGTPWYGIDMDQSNLPQEINRDDRAISFKKGCYLGQETVARIDALGHVNQLLVSLEIEAAKEPESGTQFLENGKVVGRITSIARNGDRFRALGFVRRSFAEKGMELRFDGGRASVIQAGPDVTD